MKRLVKDQSSLSTHNYNNNMEKPRLFFLSISYYLFVCDLPHIYVCWGLNPLPVVTFNRRSSDVLCSFNPRSSDTECGRTFSSSSFAAAAVPECRALTYLMDEFTKHRRTLRVALNHAAHASGNGNSDSLHFRCSRLSLIFLERLFNLLPYFHSGECRQPTEHSKG